MTIEEKAKAYDEALKRARQFSEHPLQEDSSNIVEYIFPELQESKDERIRKEIIETFKILGDGKIPVDINYADIFTWLEKQGGQKFAWSEEDEKMIQDIISDIAIAQEQVYCKNRCEDEINWLESLRPQNHWKPSDEQIEALDNFIFAKYPNIEKYEKSVKLLYNDLKKLKGE